MLNKIKSIFGTKQASDNKTFNLILTGYGGQGVITLAKLVTAAAQKQSFQVLESELHGLAQRGGSLQCQIRFGEVVFSPQVADNDADLIIGMDFIEAVRAKNWAKPQKTTILAESGIFWPYDDQVNLEELETQINQSAKKVIKVAVEDKVLEITGDKMSTNIYFFGMAVGLGILPIKPEIAWQAVAESLNEKFHEINKKVFDEALKYQPNN